MVQHQSESERLVDNNNNDNNNGSNDGDKAEALEVTLLEGPSPQNHHHPAQENNNMMAAAQSDNNNVDNSQVMDQSIQMLDVSRIELIRSDDPRFGPKHPSLRNQTKLEKDKVQVAIRLNRKKCKSEGDENDY